MNASLQIKNMISRSNLRYTTAWLLTSAVAVMLALLVTSASYVDGEYIPAGIDSFYHARRILDTAIGERGFYQFDNMIHVPEGSWINWPWGYDYLMASLLSFALWLRPSLDPMAFLAHVPVVWVCINMGLLALVARRMGLSPSLTAVAMLGYAMFPLTQTMHGVGNIDHHYVELTFVLATLLAGLGFFSADRKPSAAVTLGIVLGLASAFHNGLFILQIPVLLCFLVLWLRGQMPELTSLYRFAAALVGSTLLILLPSAPFQDMQFQFWTLSWFHLYIASCSATGVIFIGLRPFNKTNVGLLLLLGVLLVSPLLANILTGAAFLGGDLIYLDQITEVKSPISRLTDMGGMLWLAAFYSYLVFLTPVLILLFAVRGSQSKEPQAIFFSICVVLGLVLLLTQIRFNPFGTWALLIPSALLVQELSKRFGISMLATAAGALLIVAFVFQPALKNRLIRKYPAGMNREYAASRTLFKSLAESCAADPGVVISYSDDGHYIRYHTDCSVIANNFIMTPQHEEKILEVDRKLQLDPVQFLEQVTDVDYVFVRMFGSFEEGPNGIQESPIERVVSRNSPLFIGLTFGENIPHEYRLIDEIPVGGGRDFAFARVYKIVRDEDSDDSGPLPPVQ
jgi:asparagine N-glycosylation enzyme membrane subunit Stt3